MTARPCNDLRVPAGRPSRRALVAAVFGGAALVVLLRPAVMLQPVGALAVSRPLVASVLPTDVRATTVPPGDAPFFTTTPPPASAPADPDAPTPADRAAGVVRRTVTQTGSGEFDVVPGSVPAPGPGTVHVVRVEVERGLPVDGARFAGFVLATLNDDRSWGHGGATTFARTDGDAPITVALASPDTTARLCDDRRTHGTLSCRNGPRAVLTFHRWVNATDEYADNITGYRQYVVNHEVGHALGHGHERCPGPGRVAPVMQQQTLGLNGCVRNPWPHPADPPAPAPSRTTAPPPAAQPLPSAE
jgi:hypothetical protein